MRKAVLLALLANLILLFPVGSSARAAAECLAAPNATSPRGSHWYYHLDRANRRKCWYLGPQGQKTNPSATQLEAHERRPAASGPSLTATIPSAATTGVVQQPESEAFTAATAGGGPADESSIQSDPRNVPKPGDGAALVSEPDPAPSSANEQDENEQEESSVWPTLPLGEPPAVAQPVAEPPPAQGTQWLYLFAVLAGALAAAGYAGRAAVRHGTTGWFDRYARRLRLRAFPAPITRVSGHDRRPGVPPSQSSLSFVRAPNLAWLTDETMRQAEMPQPAVWRADGLGEP